MARLPSRLDLSGPASLRSGRAIAVADTSGIGRGIAQFGAAVAGVGQDIVQQQNVVDIARAEAYKNQQFLAVENDFANDPDYSTVTTRAAERSKTVVDDAANLIRDPRMRERWQIGAGTDAARLNDAVNDRGVALKRQAETVAADEALDVNSRLFSDPTTPEDIRKKARADIEGAIQMGERSGLLTPAEASARRAAYLEKADQQLALNRANLARIQDPAGLARSLGINVQPTTGGAIVLPGVDPKLPAGMRNNNPGNIKFVGQGAKQGVLGPSQNTDQGDAQAVFATPEAGMAAAYKLALKKYGDGKTTANQIIAGERGWTPGNKEAAANVARGMGLNPDEDLNLSDPSRAQSFLRSLVRQEHGPASDAYSDDMIRSVVEAKGDIVFGNSESIAAGQGYLDVAKAFLGANEGRDAGALSAFIKKSTGVTLDPRQTAWCAAYVNAVLGSQGIEGTGSLAARSFLEFGDKIDAPEKGDVVVLSRGADPSKGHVGFFMGYDETGNVKVLAGNQGNGVSVASFDKGKVLGFRRPPDASTPAKADAMLSTLPGGGPSGGMVVTQLDPQYAALPFSTRLQLAASAQEQLNAQQQAAITQQKAQYSAYNDSINLGIVTGEVSSEEQILNAGLEDKDTAARLTQFRSRQKEASATDLAVRDYLAGGLSDLNPLDSDQRGTANKVYDVLQKNAAAISPEAQEAVTSDFIQRTNVIPNPVVASLRKGQYSNDPATFASSMNEAARINTMAPIAFDTMPGGDAIQRDLTTFQNLVTSRGFSSEEAAQRIIERRSEDAKRNETVLGPAADKAVKDLEVSDLTSEFATGYLGFGRPGAGADTSTQNQLLAEYREAFREEFIRAGGDEDEAKAQAARLLKKTWGESTISGERQLMKYPPEKFYPPVAGGYGYLRDDALETAKQLDEETSPENVFLRPDAATSADIRAGRPPRYRLFYTREIEGQKVIDQVPGYWAAPEQRQAAGNQTLMDDAAALRAEEADILPGTDRGAALDQYLGGYGVPDTDNVVNLPQVEVQGDPDAYR